jgi:hypothetical protein
LARTLAILAESFHCFLQAIQANNRKVPQAMMALFKILSNSSVILRSDAVYSPDTDRVFKKPETVALLEGRQNAVH